MKPVRDTHGEPGLPLFLRWQIDIAAMNGKFKVQSGDRKFEVALMCTVLQSIAVMFEKCWKMLPAQLLA